MKKLVLSALMLGGISQLLTGCIFVSDDDPDPVDPVGQFDVAWILDPGCVNSDDAAQVISKNVDTGVEYEDIYNCADGSGITSPLPLGDYDVWVNIMDTTVTDLYAQSNVTASSLDLDGDLVAIDFTFPVDEGFFYLTWNLVDDATDEPLTCDEVFSGGVEVVTTAASNNEAVVDIWNCDDFEGTTAEYLIGDYTVVVDILDENDQAMGVSIAKDATISYGNELVDLGNYEFAFQ